MHVVMSFIGLTTSAPRGELGVSHPIESSEFFKIVFENYTVQALLR